MKKFILATLIILWMVQPSSALAVKHGTHKKHTKQTIKHVASKKNHHKVTSTKSHSAKKHGKPTPRRLAHKKITVPNVRSEETVKNEVTDAKPAFGFMASMKHHLVDYVHKTVSTLRYSVYKMGGTRFDVSKGIYVLDCSDYIDNILEEVYPNAFSSLVNSTGSDKPTTQHYYDFFNGLDDQSNQYWSKVNDVDQLESGDVLVFRYKNPYGAARGGHVMVVMEKPIPDGDGYLVRVADSAPSGHSEDTRHGRVSGIGIGTLVLKTNPDTGEPSAYAWKVGASWKSNVKIAMARPNGN